MPSSECFGIDVIPLENLCFSGGTNTTYTFIFSSFIALKYRRRAEFNVMPPSLLFFFCRLCVTSTCNNLPYYVRYVVTEPVSSEDLPFSSDTEDTKANQYHHHHSKMPHLSLPYKFLPDCIRFALNWIFAAINCNICPLLRNDHSTTQPMITHRQQI
jgi:hypothetical protein